MRAGIDIVRRSARRRALIGLAAMLAGAVIGYVAYNANSGLPFQHRYMLNVQVPDANRLIPGAEVRIAGVRVGEVLGTEAEPAASGEQPYSRVALALDPSAGPLPVDTTVEVRPASVLGLTYVDLRPGVSTDVIPSGGTLPLARARSTVDLTDLFQIFGGSAGRSFRASLRGLAGGLAGRGAELNATFGHLARLLRPFRDVAAALAAPATRLHGFLTAYERLANALAPAAGPLAGLVESGATTLGAFARERDALGAAIGIAPSAERATTVAFRRADPALRGLARLAVELRQAGQLLEPSLSEADATLRAARPTLRGLPRFSRRLRGALRALGRLLRDEVTSRSLVKLRDLTKPTNTVLDLLEPEQVYCNAIALWGIDFSSTFGALGAGVGPSLPNLVLTTAGARNESLQNATPSSNVGINPLPHENRNECEAGNEPWTGAQQLNNPPGYQSRTTRDTAPPPGVRALARRAGLLRDPAGVGP